jgi:putative ABC transport system permease protein
VWLIGWRDLQFRRRRFAIAIGATGLVFAMALLLSGVSGSFTAEIDRSVSAFGADRWIVPEGSEGPFSNSNAFAADEVVDGVEGAARVDPMVMSRIALSDKDVMIFGMPVGGLGPKAMDGRNVRARGEIVVDESLDASLGDTLDLGGKRFDVVGTYSGRTIFAGSPTAVVTIADARELGFANQPLATSLVVRGVPRSVPDGYQAISNAAAVDDLGRPLKQATGTIDFLRVLLWVIAVGIIGSIVYMTVLERTRDFAVMKATGVSSRSILGGLVMEAVVVAVAAAIVATALAQVLAPLLPMRVEISTTAYILLPVIAAVAGMVSSLVGLRRAVGVDPALAFS